ncbi:MAG: InlB B-repeat-containing protein [Clostridia bacterium]|nr:InlB B-repeat-containing protein [Clostridia bacterium]
MVFEREKINYRFIDTTALSVTKIYAPFFSVRKDEPITVAVKMNGIVAQGDYSNAYIVTNLGTFEYAGGAGTDVLYFSGVADACNTSSYKVTKHVGGFTNLSGEGRDNFKDGELAVDMSERSYVSLTSDTPMTNVPIYVKYDNYNDDIKIQWYSSKKIYENDGEAIEGADSISFTPTEDLVGKYLYVELTDSDGCFTGSVCPYNPVAQFNVSSLPIINISSNPLLLKCDDVIPCYSRDSINWYDYGIPFIVTGSTDINCISIISGNFDLYFDGLSITNSTSAPVAIATQATLKPYLFGDNILTSMQTERPALWCPNSAALFIDDATSDDSTTLSTSSSGSAASIGGIKKQSAGNITINGGTINTISQFGAGIGGGVNGGAGNITINGGTVNVKDNGILGAGYYSVMGGTVTVNGGTVTAGGIGSGILGVNTDVTINGGFVTAYQCGIACGSGGTLTITGGTVLSTSSISALGGNMQKGNCTILISGGTVTATSKAEGAAIGGGENGIATVKISGGTVTAISNAVGAAIGSGYFKDLSSNTVLSTVEISGGVVNALSNSRGAAIGGSYTNIGANVTITGGTVAAVSKYGMAIGGGEDDSAHSGTLVMTGGSLNASSFDNTPTDEYGKKLSLVTVTADDGANAKIVVFVGLPDYYGTEDIYGDADGTIYLYLPDGYTADDIAVYSENAILYTVIWNNYDGTTLETDENVKYGTMPEYNGVAPEKEADVTYYYVFDGWDKEITVASENITYTATFKAVMIDYTVTFIGLNGRVIKTINCHYGDEVIAPEAPDEGGFDFTGWDSDISALCTGNATYTARYSEKERYTVTVTGGTQADTDNTEVTVYKGDSITVKANSAESGMEFEGWYCDGVLLSSEHSFTFTPETNCELTAKFIESKGGDVGCACGATTISGSNIIGLLLLCMVALLAVYRRKKNFDNKENKDNYR